VGTSSGGWSVLALRGLPVTECRRQLKPPSLNA
jgi:hypothetical protein